MLDSIVNSNSYVGTGAVDTYAYGFKIFAETELLVTQRDDNDVETVLVLNTDYTVTGVGAELGGNVVLSANLTSNYALKIRREVALLQDYDIRNPGDFYPETHENFFDYVMMIAQQLNHDISRAVRLPETTTGFDAQLVEPVALQWQRVNAAGTGFEWVSMADMSSVMTSVDASMTLVAGVLSVANPMRFCTMGGAVDVLTGSVSPAPASLTNNIRIYADSLGANTSTTPTFNLNGLGAKTIVKEGNIPLLGGDIGPANSRLDLIFDSSLDKWILMNPMGGPTKANIQSGAYTIALTGGSSTVYTLALSPTITQYAEGMDLRAHIHTANTSTTPTINVDGLGAKTIKRLGGLALHVGDLPLNHPAKLHYDGTDMILENPAFVQVHTHADDDEGGPLQREHTLLQNLWYTDANFVRNPDFETDSIWTKGAGWTISGGVATHSSGTANLSQAGIIDQDGANYRVIFTIAGRTAGSVTPYIGATAGTARSADGVHTETIASPGSGQPHDIIFTPTTDFDGTITRVVVQRLNSTTVLPQDTTWPQISEGEEYMTGEVTPANATDIIEVELNIIGEHDNGTYNRWSVALFQDAIAAALKAIPVWNTAGMSHPLRIKHRMVAGTTSEIKFRARCGGSNSGVWTLGSDVGGAENNYMNIKVYKGA